MRNDSCASLRMRIVAWCAAFVLALGLGVSATTWLTPAPAFAEEQSQLTIDTADLTLLGDDGEDDCLTYYLKTDQAYESIDFADLTGEMSDGMIAVINGNYYCEGTSTATISNFAATAEDIDGAVGENGAIAATLPNAASTYLDEDYDTYVFWITNDDYDMFFVILQMPGATAEPEDLDETFTISANGKRLTAISSEDDAWNYYDYMAGDTVSVRLYTVTLPQGTSSVDLTFEQPRLVYNYDGTGNYLAGWVSDYTQGATAITCDTDANNDGTLDYLQVQRTYKTDWTDGKLLYAIAFTYADAATNEASVDQAITALSSRFIKGGADRTISNNTFYAALALNKLGDGKLVDTDAVLAQLETAKQGQYFSAGTYAKYILALTAGGYDCTALVADMESMITDPSQVDVWSAVCILPLYSYGLYEPGITDLESSLRDVISASANEDGLLGGYGYFDTQTTAQGLLAVLPYTDSAAVSFVKQSKNALIASACADGGFAYQTGDTSPNLDATATIVMALTAAQVDLATTNGPSAIDYLLDQADAGFASYNTASPSNETMSAATVLAALVAYDKDCNVQQLGSASTISVAAASLSALETTYTGKQLKPAVTVKSATGRTLTSSDYTVAYKSNTSVGTATVTITGKGNYQGTVTKTFKINPKSTSISKVKKAKKAFTVKWKKATSGNQITGYQIRYATKADFANAKTVTVSKAKTTSKKIKKLAKKTTYYVQVRTYKTVNGTKYYGAWSKTKSVKTK